MSEQEPDRTTLSRTELEQIKRIADRDGVTIEEAATRLGQDWLKNKVKSRTGKGPARVYPIKGKK